jgi:hypothetical protein
MENFKYYDHLGFHNSYYIIEGNKIIVESLFEKIIERIPVAQRVLDYTALVQVFSSGYCFGDRTLIKGMRKSPWMAKPNSDYTDWDYCKVPDHGEMIVNEEKIALNFYNLLEEELISYVEPHHNIGILLTGGMDSRIVAALLKNAMERGKISDKNIYAYTWGHEESRDVVYASKIAQMYGWSWKHMVVDETQMEENCQVAIAYGCEFTPLHLHAMPQVARESHLDCVLAGSFGDSVGRAEFSGRRVRGLENLETRIKNIGGILRQDFHKLVVQEVRQDLRRYHELFPKKHLYQQYEQDQQLHYMRRMLNACMGAIDKEMPLYQMFTSPEVFGYMWSLSPEVRNDEVYKVLLSNIAPELLAIPWARTGLPYPETQGIPDSYGKKHHDYGRMIRQHFLESIHNIVKQNESNASLLFDVNAVHNLVKNVRSLPINGKLLFEEKLLFVAQVLQFIVKFEVKVQLPNYSSDFFSVLKEDLKYKGRYLHNKFK